MKKWTALFLLLGMVAACDLGTEVPSDGYNTALGVSSPTNNEKIYNPTTVNGSYFDDKYDISTLTVHYTPNFGGPTNSVIAQVNGSQKIKLFTTDISILTPGFYYLWATAVNADNHTTQSPVILIESMGNEPDTNNFDFVAPLVNISSPADGQNVSAQFTVSGTATDDKSGIYQVFLQLDAGVFSPIAWAAGTWSTNITLSTTGTHTIRVYATDLSNNVSLTNEIDVEYVAGLPSILISNPANNLLTNGNSLNISGTSGVDGGSISSVAVKVNSQSWAAATGTGSWSIGSVTLDIEGTNQIAVMAISDSSVSNTVYLSVIKDMTDPALSMSSPTNGQIITSGQVAFSGTANDNLSGLKSIKAGINGSYIDADINGSNWTASLAYGDGTHTVSAYAVDNALNQGTLSTVTVTIDTTAPILSVNTVPASTTNANLTINGTSMDSTAGIAGVYLSINSSAFTPATGTTAWSKDISLNNGQNTILVYALDNAGLSSPTNSYNVTKTSGNGYTVYFKKPTAWPGAFIHYWPGGTTWGDTPAMTSQGDEWYSWTFSDLSITNFLFTDMNSTNADGSKDHQTSDLYRTSTGYYWTNGQWYDTDPEDATYPIISVDSPEDYREVTSSTLYILGTAAGGGGISGVYVSVNHSAYAAATGTSSWSYNAGLNMGTNTVEVYAMGNSGYSTETNLIHVIRKSGSGDNHPGSYSGNLGATLYANGVEFAIWWRDTLVDDVYVKGDFNGWNDTSLPLQHISGGMDDDIWWVFIPGANAGDEYRFVGRSGSTYTTVIDPASKYNRYDGGNSVIVDHSTFTWTDSSWTRPAWQDYAIYELHIKDFSEANGGQSAPFATSNPGKYRGVIDGLSYLTNMGITAIEIMPPSEFGDAGYSWGYNTALYFAPESGYAGSPLNGQDGVDEMKELINACHQYGIAVIFDMVFNHTGGSNPFWTIDEVAYFDWDGDGIVEANGPPVDSGDDKTGWGNHFNTRHPAVQRYGKQVLEYFMTEYHVDGFRFDMCEPGLVDTGFLRDAKNHCMSIDPSVFFVFEDFSFSWDLKTYGGHWNDSYHDNGIQLYRGNKNIGDFKWDIEAVPDWAGSHVEKVNYFESHDEDTLGYHAFDPTYGEGFDSGTAEARSRMASVILATSVGVPMFWMGMERLTVTEGQDTSDGAFIWGTYSGLQSYFAGVFSLRKNHAALRGPNISTMYEPSSAQGWNVYAYQRWASGDNTFVIVINSDRYSAHTVNVGFPSDGTWTKVITESSVNGTGTINVSGGSASITIGQNSAVIFMK